MMRKSLIILFGTLLLCSCVKESREHCPCYLFFAHDGFSFNGRNGSVRVTALEQNSTVLRDEYMVAELKADRADVGVPRGMAEVCVYQGIEKMTSPQDTVLIIPRGGECDSLYAISDAVPALGERARVYGKLHKQYAKVTVDFEYSDTVSSYPYTFIAKSNTMGMNIISLKPVMGEYYYKPKQIAKGVFTFNLPRQIDNGLVLEVYENGKKKSQITLGKYINDSLYYDWKAESLADINVYYDFALSTLTVTVADWGLEKMFVITI